MYLWTQTEPWRDGDFENAIIIHEASHGLSTRLTGGPLNSNCLAFGEAGGMGEGWGDMLAILLRQRATYKDTVSFEIGIYSNQVGIRNYPYSTNMYTSKPSCHLIYKILRLCCQ
jgi:extracellular elastinolytic metalloproteinase